MTQEQSNASREKKSFILEIFDSRLGKQAIVFEENEEEEEEVVEDEEELYRIKSLNVFGKERNFYLPNNFGCLWLLLLIIMISLIIFILRSNE